MNWRRSIEKWADRPVPPAEFLEALEAQLKRRVYDRIVGHIKGFSTARIQANAERLRSYGLEWPTTARPPETPKPPSEPPKTKPRASHVVKTPPTERGERNKALYPDEEQG